VALFSFLILSVFLVSVGLYYVCRDNNNLIQPHAFYTANVFVLLLLIPFIQSYLSDLFSDRKGIVFLNAMIGLSYLSFSAGFFVKKNKATVMLNRFIKKFNIESVPKVTLNLHIFIMALVAISLFVYLAEKSGFGLFSWLSSPRTGYQNYRRGFGHLYVVSMAILNVIYLYILFFRINNVRSLIVTTMIFVFVSYFYGCKGAIIFTVFEAVVFYNFFIKKVKLGRAIAIFGGLLLVFTLFFSLYRSPKSSRPLSTSILSYASYYNEGRKFFRDFKDEFRYVYGREYISSLWMYVPRAFYDRKPESHGMVKYVVEHYYPGAGESGNTPAFGGPVEEYLNFGILGIIVVGIIRGYISSLFYTYFLKHRSFVGFVLLSNEMGFSIFPIMTWPAYKVLWYVLNILVLLFHKQIITCATGIDSRANLI
jgi:hypothetical protein